MGHEAKLSNSKAHPSHLTPATRLHFLKVLEPSGTAPPAGNQGFKHMCLQETFYI